jgi:hypothetical protein
MTSIEINPKGTTIRCRCLHRRTTIQVFRMRGRRWADCRCANEECNARLGIFILSPAAYFSTQGLYNSPEVPGYEA